MKWDLAIQALDKDDLDVAVSTFEELGENSKIRFNIGRIFQFEQHYKEAVTSSF